VAEAKGLWQAAGVPADRLSMLNGITYQVTELGGNTLSLAEPGMILFDSTADGYGWDTSGTSSSKVAPGMVDLLSSVAHEMGNEMGFAEDMSNGVMGLYIGVGQRHVPVSVTTTTTPVGVTVGNGSVVVAPSGNGTAAGTAAPAATVGPTVPATVTVISPVVVDAGVARGLFGIRSPLGHNGNGHRARPGVRVTHVVHDHPHDSAANNLALRDFAIEHMPVRRFGRRG
jgi:hypothetical protein